MSDLPKSNMTPLKKPRDIMGDQVRQEMEKSTARMKQLFANAELLQNRSLNVEVFRINFLPYFCGELPWSEEVTTAWSHVAGTLLNPVNLIDENQEIVAVVPAIVDTQVIQSIGRSLDGVGRVPVASADAIMAQSQQRATFSPKMAQNRLAQQLAQRFQVDARGPSERLKAQWEKLFAYFGKSPTAKEVQEASTGQKADDGDFDYEFD